MDATVLLATVQQLVRASFGDEAEFLLVRFNKELGPIGVEFSLTAQQTAEEGPEYLVDEQQGYRRVSRFPKWSRAVTATEQALLDVCVALGMELTAEHGTALKTPSPLSRRLSTTNQPLNERADHSDEHKA